MNIWTEQGESLKAVVSHLAERLVHWLPSLLGALALLLAGWLLARVVRALTRRLMSLVDAALQRVFQRRGGSPAPTLTASTRVIGELVYWIVILLFLTAALHVLGVETFTTWMNRVLAYLPTLIVGGLIIVAGFLVSSLARDVVIAAAPLETASRRLLGQATQLIILVTAIVIGADQIGINITFLIILTTVLLATLLGGMALAMSLGARTYVANLIGSRYARESYRVGQKIRLGDYEGHVLEFTLVGVVLQTAAGRINLPGKLFQEQASALLVEDSGDERAEKP